MESCNRTESLSLSRCQTLGDHKLTHQHEQNRVAEAGPGISRSTRLVSANRVIQPWEVITEWAADAGRFWQSGADQTGWSPCN
jgi:hypothetical protein